MKFSTILTTFIAVVFPIVSVAGDDCQSITDIVKGNDKFSSLLSALSAADLVDDLSGSGPFTVFAPTNDAFAKFSPAGLLELFKSKESLVNLLLYHVVPRKVFSFNLEDHLRILTLQGTTVTARTSPRVRINRSLVTTADVTACNGVIHIINTVLVPTKNPPPATARPLIQKTGKCSGGSCKQCEGDCDADHDCMEHLVCFQRNDFSFTAVPGCRGGTGDKSGTDYCIDPKYLK